jgi:hypothetical protein
MVLGRTLITSLRSPRLTSWLERHWVFPEHTPDPVPHTIRLTEVDQPHASGDGGLMDVTLHRFSLQCTVSDDGWRFGDDTAGVHLNLRDGESLIEVWGAPQPGSESSLFPALFVAMSESLRSSGLLPLHAAVVVRDGRATALAGKSGAGKSTTFWRALDSGWSPLADNFAWLNPDTLVIRGWDRGVLLAPDARERFPRDIPAESFRAEDDGKLFLPYQRIQREVVRTAVLDRLAVLERDVDAPAGSAPLGARAAVRVWWEMVGVPLDTTVRNRVAMEIALLVSRVKRYVLRIDSNPPAL